MNIPEHSHSRQGATLVEILMSLIVMGIGLVSVASIFPISMLRSMQATQLTSAALLGAQCEGYVQAFPGLVRNHYDGTNVIPNKEYRAGSVALWRYGLTEQDYALRLPANVVTVIDPIGAHRLLQSSYGTQSVNYFGNDGDQSDNYNFHAVNDGMFMAERLNAGFNLSDPAQVDAAYQMFASGDSWSTSITSKEVAGSGGGNTVTLGESQLSSDLQAYQEALAAGTPGRIVIFTVNGKQSYTAPLQAAQINYATRVITLANNIPNNGLYAGIPEVRLELYEPRYTCLITIRRRLSSLGAGGMPGNIGVDDDGNSAIDGYDDTMPPDGIIDRIDRNEVAWPGSDDVLMTQTANLVVFYRREFTPLAEQVYEASSIPDFPQQIIVRWRGDNTDLKPKLKAGNWLFDSHNGDWYRIETIMIEEQSAGNPRNSVNNREAVLSLDRPLRANVMYVIAPDRVVEVFDFAL